ASARRAATIGIAVTSQLLRDADRLEVHAEDRRHAHFSGAGVVLAGNFVQQRLNLEVIVRFSQRDAVGCAACGNLRSVEIIHTRTGGTVHEIVGGVLVRPGGAPAGGFDDLEHGIHAQEAVWINRGAALGRVERQRYWVDTAASVERVRVDVDALVV